MTCARNVLLVGFCRGRGWSGKHTFACLALNHPRVVSDLRDFACRRFSVHLAKDKMDLCIPYPSLIFGASTILENVEIGYKAIYIYIDKYITQYKSIESQFQIYVGNSFPGVEKGEGQGLVQQNYPTQAAAYDGHLECALILLRHGTRDCAMIYMRPQISFSSYMYTI